MSERMFASQSDDEFRGWLDERMSRNPNLKPLADDVGTFSEDNLAKWIELALIRIVIEGSPPERAFSPGELILGASATDWRDELLAVISLLGESAKANVVRAFVRCFDVIGPRPQDDDVNLNEGHNWEVLALELIRLVRDLRPPICAREATPLNALEKLLNITFPSSQAVLDEGLLLWRVFAHQIENEIDWPRLFATHGRFRDEYSPLVAFTMAINRPDKALYYLSKWPPHRQYRGALAKSMTSSVGAMEQLAGLNNAAERVVCYLNTERRFPIRYAEILIDPTYMFLSIAQAELDDRNSIKSAEIAAQQCEPLSIHALFEPRGSADLLSTILPNLIYRPIRLGVGSTTRDHART